MAAEPLYYALEPSPKNGRIGTVWKRPVQTQERVPGGGSSVQMGFKVCDCNEDVDGAATVIADALNRLPELEAAIRKAMTWLDETDMRDPVGYFELFTDLNRLVPRG